MINKPPPFKGINIGIPIIIPIKGRGFINHGSGLGILRHTKFDPFLRVMKPTPEHSQREAVLQE